MRFNHVEGDSVGTREREQRAGAGHGPLRLVPPPPPAAARAHANPARPGVRAVEPAAAPPYPPAHLPAPPRPWARALRLRLLDRALEHRVVPDSVLRAASRQGASARERREGRGGVVAQEERLRALLGRMSSGPIAEPPAKGRERDYELPPELLGLMLGPRRKHSCSLWEPSTETLAQAEEAMLALSCLRAQVRDGMRILDLGCGWGSLSLWLAEHYPASQVTGVSSSRREHAWLEAERDRRNLVNLEVIASDVSAFAPSGRFDRVMSIETFERMRNWRELLRRISTWLPDAGKAFLQLSSHRTLAYRVQGTWASERFLAAGLMPSHDLLPRFQEHLGVAERWVESGEHYAKTARAWVARLDAHADEALELLIADGRSRGEARAVLGGWRLFLLSADEMWGYGGGNRWLTGHYLLEPRSR